MYTEFVQALESITDLDKQILKVDELNELAYEDSILPINNNSFI